MPRAWQGEVRDRSGYLLRRRRGNGMRSTTDVDFCLRARLSEMNRPVLPDRPRSVNLRTIGARVHGGRRIPAPYRTRRAYAAVSPCGLIGQPRGRALTTTVRPFKHQGANGYLVTVSADRGWLDETGRKYPVAIDPTVMVEQGCIELQLTGAAPSQHRRWKRSTFPGIRTSRFPSSRSTCADALRTRRRVRRSFRACLELRHRRSDSDYPITNDDLPPTPEVGPTSLYPRRWKFRRFRPRARVSWSSQRESETSKAKPWLRSSWPILREGNCHRCVRRPYRFANCLRLAVQDSDEPSRCGGRTQLLDAQSSTRGGRVR